MIKEIAEMKNEILVKWLESKDTGKRNRVVVKHVVDKTKSITIGGILWFPNAIKRAVLTCLTGRWQRSVIGAEAQMTSKMSISVLLPACLRSPTFALHCMHNLGNVHFLLLPEMNDLSL